MVTTQPTPDLGISDRRPVHSLPLWDGPLTAAKTESCPIFGGPTGRLRTRRSAACPELAEWVGGHKAY